MIWVCGLIWMLYALVLVLVMATVKAELRIGDLKSELREVRKRVYQLEMDGVDRSRDVADDGVPL